MFAGWISDTYFESKRHQTILWMTVGMLGAFLCMAWVGSQSAFLFASCLSLCGFMLMGPDSLLAGAGAMDVGGKSNAIVAAGIINGLGSIGPIFQEEMIGFALEHGGYTTVFRMLVGMCILGVFGSLFLYWKTWQAENRVRIALLEESKKSHPTPHAA